MARYRKKPVVIEAMQWTGANYTEAEVFVGEPVTHGRYEASPTALGGAAKIIRTLQGEMRATPGDWIIKGVKGEFYPCKDDIFRQTYEAVADATRTTTPEDEAATLRLAMTELARRDWRYDD